MDMRPWQKKVAVKIIKFLFYIFENILSVTFTENGKLKDFSLTIKPEFKSSSKGDKANEEEQGDRSRNNTDRQTYILSFSPRQWKVPNKVDIMLPTISYNYNDKRTLTLILLFLLLTESLRGFIGRGRSPRSQPHHGRAGQMTVKKTKQEKEIRV